MRADRQTLEDYGADLRSNVAYNVRRLRKARGWDRHALARHAGVTEHTVERVEQERDFYVSTLVKLALGLGARMPELFWQPREFCEIPTFDQETP